MTSSPDNHNPNFASVEYDIRLSQTYPQIMNQLQSHGLNSNDLISFKQAFVVAQQMSDGIYRAQGVPLINHLIRTASILLVENQSIDCVQAGLLHAVFALERFDNSTRTSSIKRRQKDLNLTFDSLVMDLVIRYGTLQWYSKAALEHHKENLDNYSALEKQVIAIRLANELEDHLDFAMLYTSSDRLHSRSEAYGIACIELADELGLVFISNGLRDMLNPQNQRKLINEICWPINQGYELQDRKWVAGVSERVLLKLKQGLRKIKRKLV